MKNVKCIEFFMQNIEISNDFSSLDIIFNIFLDKLFLYYKIWTKIWKKKRKLTNLKNKNKNEN